jgi:hypothetical protein
MSQGFPIIIKLDPQLAAVNKTIKAMLSKTEMWINFAALKNGWYSDPNCVLEFEFTLLSTDQLTERVAFMVYLHQTVGTA